MNDGLIPNRYAKALYKFAAQSGQQAEVYGQMKSLEAAFASSRELKQVVNNPFVPVEKKQGVLLAAAGAQPGGPLDKFILLVDRNNRVEFLRAMALSYSKLYRTLNGIAQVKVETASQLPDTEIQKIVDLVKKQLGGQTLELTQTVNPALIGGFRITVDSLELDASVKNEIEKLRLKLLSI